MMKTVAYSYDVLPWWVLPAAFRVSGLSGSVFALLATTNGPVPGASGVRPSRLIDTRCPVGMEALPVLETVASQRPCYDRAAVFEPGRGPATEPADQLQRAQERGDLLQS